MEHDIIVIKSNRTVDDDYTPRRLRALIRKALKELKAKQEAENEAAKREGREPFDLGIK